MYSIARVAVVAGARGRGSGRARSLVHTRMSACDLSVTGYPRRYGTMPRGRAGDGPRSPEHCRPGKYLVIADLAREAKKVRRKYLGIAGRTLRCDVCFALRCVLRAACIGAPARDETCMLLIGTAGDTVPSLDWVYHYPDQHAMVHVQQLSCLVGWFDR